MGIKIRNAVGQYIRKESLFSLPDKIIVGLSGGADSVVMLSILHKLGYQCIAAHCNFHLRGEESMRDEEFSEALAVSLGIPFYKIDFDTVETAKQRGISIEMAARDLRYEWFEQLRQEVNAAFIAVAHHQNDNIETLLLNLTRGTGIAGISGIKPKNNFIVRPLLCISRKEIEEYASAEDLEYITDSTNLEDIYIRNKIRLNLLPLLETMNPAIRTALLQTIHNLNEANKVYTSSIKASKQEIFRRNKQSIHIPTLLQCPSPESVLFEILKEYGFNKEVVKEIEQAIESQSGKEFYSPLYRLIKDREYLFLTVRTEKETALPIYSIKAEDSSIKQPIALSISYQAVDNNFRINKEKKFAYFDADKLSFPLTIRKWREGDAFIPFGMKGQQKLSDYFNNNKFSKLDKEQAWLLCSGKDIIWLINHRSDERYRIDKTTKKACIIKLL